MVTESPPEFLEEMPYAVWRSKVEMWQLVTPVEKKKQALVVVLEAFDGHTTASLVASLLLTDDLHHNDGMARLLARLDEAFEYETFDSAIFDTAFVPAINSVSEIQTDVSLDVNEVETGVSGVGVSVARSHDEASDEYSGAQECKSTLDRSAASKVASDLEIMDCRSPRSDNVEFLMSKSSLVEATFEEEVKEQLVEARSSVELQESAGAESISKSFKEEANDVDETTIEARSAIELGEPTDVKSIRKISKEEANVVGGTTPTRATALQQQPRQASPPLQKPAHREAPVLNRLQRDVPRDPNQPPLRHDLHQRKSVGRRADRHFGAQTDIWVGFRDTGQWLLVRDAVT